MICKGLWSLCAFQSGPNQRNRVSVTGPIEHLCGIALLDDKVYLATLDAHLVALDARSGKVIWDVTVDDYNQFGSGQMIWKLDGGYCAGSDHRKDGGAVGF